MLIALEKLEHRPWDERGDLTSVLGTDGRIVLVGKNQRRDGDPRQRRTGVVVSHLVEQHHRHVARGRGALETTEPAQVAPAGVGDEHRAQSERPEVPVGAEQGSERLVLLRRRDCRTACICGVEDEAVHSFRMAGGERGGRRTAPRVTEQTAPLDAGGREHGLELVDIIFDRRDEAAAVRQPASEPVVPDETMSPGELGASTGSGGV